MSDVSLDDARPLDWPERRAAFRLALGRHRAAIRLSIALLVFGLAGPLSGAAADGLRDISLIGYVISGIAETARSTKTLVLASAIVVLTRLALRHPFASSRTLPALATTPWRPGRPLPQGDVTLTGSTGLLPAATIALLYFVGLPGAPLIAVGAALGYAAGAVVVALVVGHVATALAIVTSLAVLVKLHVSADARIFSALLVGILALADVAQRRAIAEAFRSGRTFDPQRINNRQRRTALGWLTHLPLQRKPRRVGEGAMAAVAAGICLASLTSAGDVLDEVGLRGAVSIVLFAVCVGRTVERLVGTRFAYGLIARVFTGRLFVPRMDGLFLPLLVVLALIIGVQTYPWPHHAAENPAIAGAFLALGIGIVLWIVPTRLAWQTTGASRIVVTPSGVQKQAEASMKRMTEQRST